MRKWTLVARGSLLLAALVSCTGKKKGEDGISAAAGDALSSSSDSVSETSALRDASWSATIDGASVTGAGVDELQQNNAAYVLPLSGDGPKHLVFHLYSTRNGADESAKFALRFSLPPKAGQFTKTAHGERTCDCDITLNEDSAKSGDLMKYWADSVVITVTALTATRVTGTFWGTFAASAITPRARARGAKITQGKFDIPVGTSKITPE